MKLKELLLSIKKGQKVYKITPDQLCQYIYIGKHPQKYEYYYFISSGDATNAKGFYLVDNSDWEIDYEKAKKVFKIKVIEKINILSEIYFDSKLKIMEDEKV